MDSKACSHCGRIRPVEEFQKDATKLDGYRYSCKECVNASRRARIEKNRHNYNRRQKLYAKNRDFNALQRRREYQTAWANDRRKNDPSFRLAERIRVRMRDAITLRKGFALKAASTELLLGCSIQEARRHLEAGFLPGMTWDNLGWGPGFWNIDHIRPCASFDLTDPKQQYTCFHYSNMQPLWFEDNMSKGARWERRSA